MATCVDIIDPRSSALTTAVPETVVALHQEQQPQHLQYNSSTGAGFYNQQQAPNLIQGQGFGQLSPDFYNYPQQQFSQGFQGNNNNIKTGKQKLSDGNLTPVNIDKRRMGRKKIQITRIQDERNRQVSFILY